MVDGDRIVCESIAGLLYLEDAFPEHKLLPADLDTRAKVLQRTLESETLIKAAFGAVKWKVGAVISLGPCEVREDQQLLCPDRRCN